MNRRLVSAAGVATVAFALTACEASKSSTPLSATVAGPIPGVNISAPKMLEPAAGQKIAVDKQPVTLLVENAGSNGARPLTYAFEIATDAGFNSKVFSRDGIAQGDAGRTSLRLPDPLASGRTYFWRARAEDGANTGPYAAPAGFDVFTATVIESPALVAPVPNAMVSTVRPKLMVVNARRSGPVGAVTYLAEIADSEAFSNKIASWSTVEQANQTVLELSADLAANKIYYWHVRAYDATTLGPWSLTSAFATPAMPAAAPPGIPLPPSAGDAIDLSQTTILNSPRDLASWPATAAITRLDLRASGVHVEFSKKDGAGRWPDITPPGWAGPLQYTLGMALNIDGRWYASAPIEYWNGLDVAGGPPSQYALNWFYDPARWAPMTYHQPAVGEMIGFFVCAGDCRNRSDASASPVRERSNVVLVPMPTDGGASYAFSPR
jgi:hypothetical protein